MTKTLVLLPLVAMLVSFAVKASVIVTPFLGYTMGGVVKDGTGENYDISPSANLALAIEFPFQNGRMGMFYSQQDSSLDVLELDTRIQYLQFQSSAEYQLNNTSYTYIGAGLGASYTSGEWVPSHLGFAASIFGGMAYHLTKSLVLNGQIRWQGTMVSNDTVSICNLPTDEQRCLIGFKTQWMNQFQTHVGVSFNF